MEICSFVFMSIFMRTILLIFFFPLFSFGQSLVEEVELLFEQKQYFQAETLLLKNIEPQSKNLVAIEFLGDAYGYQEKWDEAIEQYEILVETKQDNANYHYKYGGALGFKALKISKFRALGLIRGIKNSFVKAARLDSSHIDTRWALVEFYMQLPGIVGGSKKKSLKYAQELEDLSPINGYLAKGYIYEYSNEPKLAKIFYEMAMNLSDSISCAPNVVETFEIKSDSISFITTSGKTKYRNLRNALHYQIGKVCAEYNLHLDKGIECLHTYVKQYTSKDGVPIDWAYYRIAQLYKHKNDKAQALKWIDNALELRSDFPQALKERIIILKMMR